MKKLIIILTFLLMTTFGIARDLDDNAKWFRKANPTAYEQTLKKHALEKWGTNYDMVVYEINKQADAFIELVMELDTINPIIFYNAIAKWSIDGYKESNLDLIRDSNAGLAVLHCNWKMVLYEYKKQVKAKNSF